jgi:hypothetical protein
VKALPVLILFRTWSTSLSSCFRCVRLIAPFRPCLTLSNDSATSSHLQKMLSGQTLRAFSFEDFRSIIHIHCSVSHGAVWTVGTKISATWDHWRHVLAARTSAFVTIRSSRGWHLFRSRVQKLLSLLCPPRVVDYVCHARHLLLRPHVQSYEKHACDEAVRARCWEGTALIVHVFLSKPRSDF